jgi:hypothetical protein
MHQLAGRIADCNFMPVIVINCRSLNAQFAINKPNRTEYN